jgi:2-methylfumaryl-CoA isomerase
MFEAEGVTWSVYNTVGEAIASEPRLFAGNPIYSTVTHGGGDAYPTPGAAVRLPQDERLHSAASARIGAHTDEVLADLLGMGNGEIGRLHDQGLVA